MVRVKGRKPKPIRCNLDIVAGNGNFGFGGRSQKGKSIRRIGKHIPLDRVVVGRKTRKDSGGLGLRFGDSPCDPLIVAERRPKQAKGKRRRGKQIQSFGQEIISGLKELCEKYPT